MWQNRVLSHGGLGRRLIVTRHRDLSTSAPSPRIVSRRAWEAHLRKHPPQSKAARKPDEEKPWPRSFQIAGYAMAAVFVPYSIAWFAASNGPVRDLLSSVIPNLDEYLRHHFGHEEHDPHRLLSYYERQQGEEPKYQLDGEPTFRERLQYEQAEALKRSQVKVRVRVDGDTDSLVETALPGSIPARSEAILKAIGKEGTSVALDFGNVISDSPEEEEDELTPDPPTSTQDEFPLEHQTYMYSMWHYLSPMQQLQQQEASPRMSSRDIDLSRLEHEIQQLQDDLNDVNCIRDIDDMTRELKEKKSALRNLRWKRRLGIS
jgi:hypothetical protein